MFPNISCEKFLKHLVTQFLEEYPHQVWSDVTMWIIVVDAQCPTLFKQNGELTLDFDSQGFTYSYFISQDGGDCYKLMLLVYQQRLEK